MIARTLFNLFLLMLLLCQPSLADIYDDLIGSASETIIFDGPPFACVRQALGFSCSGNHDPTSIHLESVLRDLDTRLGKVWIYRGRPIVASFTVSKSGKITKIVIRKGSGTEITDSSIKEALQKISPLEPLQAELLDLDLTLTFGYKAQRSKCVLLNTCDY